MNKSNQTDERKFLQMKIKCYIDYNYYLGNFICYVINQGIFLQ